MHYLREVFESGCTQIFGEEILITVVIRVPCLRDAVRQGIPYGLREVSILRPFFMIIYMVFVYVIESLTDATWYTGMAIDANKRLVEHNRGKNRFTKGHLPWKIIYTEQHPDWTIARQREKYLKTAAGKLWLRKTLDHGGDTGSLRDAVRKSQPLLVSGPPF
jgi:predicted GIY-YIG superfamily endonuclease